MVTYWVFNDCTDAEKQEAKDIWGKKYQPRIERLVSQVAPDLRELRLTVYHFPKPSQWEVRGVLHLPSGSLAAHERTESLEASLDKVAEELVREIKEHKSRLRQDYLYRRRRQLRQNLSAAGSLLDEDFQARRRDAFFQLLQPLLVNLYGYARHELRIRELEGKLPRNAYTPQDLVDDVLIRAWEEYQDRPPKMELDLWLTDLLRSNWTRSRRKCH